MPPSLHSKFSASASARLLACPGSYELGIRADDGSRRSTIFSAEGTLAHAIGEVCVSTGKEPHDFIGETRQADGFEFTINGEFADHVSVYVDFIRGLRAMGFVVMLEQQVDPSIQWKGIKPGLPVNLFGTGDCIAYNPATRELVIGDLKFGAGVPVDALGNTQLRYYGSGACHPDVLVPLCKALGVPFNGVDTVTLTIVQPRAFHKDGPIRRETLTPNDLQDWTLNVLHPGVALALSDGGQTTCAGTWCRFCPVLAHCDKPRDLSFETAQAAFRNTPIHEIPVPGATGDNLPDVHLTDAQLGDLLDKVIIFEPWLKALRELAHVRMTAGRAVPGHKLVNKRATRKWADKPEEMGAILTGAGLASTEFQETQLLTPAQVEREIGKKEYAARVAPHVVKTSSGTSIAVEGDPRSRVERRSAQAAFAATPNTRK